MKNPLVVTHMDLTIVIVNYNTRDHLANCLDSVFAHLNGCRFQVHVVDNHSSDGSVGMIRKMFPAVRITENKHNVGFAKANNQILKCVEDTRFFVALNPDIIVTEGSLQRMLSFMENTPDAGLVGCKLLNPDRTLQYSCRRWPQPLTILSRGLMLDRFLPDAGMFRRYFMRDWDHEQVAEVDWLQGSCMMIRREALNQAGLFDEHFFMYYEDVDLCLRFRTEGWKIFYLPEPMMIHHHMQQSHKVTSLRTRLIHIRSALYFFRKYDLFRSLFNEGCGLNTHFKIVS